MKYAIRYDTTLFVREAISAVYHTLFIAAVLVLVVILVFLQNFRGMLVPATTVPVTLIGAFIAMNGTLDGLHAVRPRASTSALVIPRTSPLTPSGVVSSAFVATPAVAGGAASAKVSTAPARIRRTAAARRVPTKAIVGLLFRTTQAMVRRRRSSDVST